MQEVLGFLPPSSPKLTQCAHPALPGTLLCVLGRSQDTLKEQRLVGPQHLLCVTLPLALGTFSSSPEAQKETRQIKSFTHHPYPVPTTSIPRRNKSYKRVIHRTKFLNYSKGHKKKTSPPSENKNANKDLLVFRK